MPSDYLYKVTIYLDVPKINNDDDYDVSEDSPFYNITEDEIMSAYAGIVVHRVVSTHLGVFKLLVPEPQTKKPKGDKKK